MKTDTDHLSAADLGALRRQIARQIVTLKKRGGTDAIDALAMYRSWMALSRSLGRIA